MVGGVIVHSIYRAISCFVFFFSSRRRHTRFDCDWSSDVCSSDLVGLYPQLPLSEQKLPFHIVTFGPLGGAGALGDRRLMATTEATAMTMMPTTPKIGRASCRERV